MLNLTGSIDQSHRAVVWMLLAMMIFCGPYTTWAETTTSDLTKAHALKMQRQYQQARKMFLDLARNKTTALAVREEAAYYLGFCSIMGCDYARAIHDFKWYLKNYSAPPGKFYQDALYVLARTHEMLGELPLAVQMYKKCLAVPKTKTGSGSTTSATSAPSATLTTSAASTAPVSETATTTVSAPEDFHDKAAKGLARVEEMLKTGEKGENNRLTAKDVLASDAVRLYVDRASQKPLAPGQFQRVKRFTEILEKTKDLTVASKALQPEDLQLSMVQDLLRMFELQRREKQQLPRAKTPK